MDYQELLIKYMQVNHAEPMNGRDHTVLKRFILWLNNNAAQQSVHADVAPQWRCKCGWANFENVKLCSACGTQRR